MKITIEMNPDEIADIVTKIQKQSFETAKDCILNAFDTIIKSELYLNSKSNESKK